jgi:hypothetical protein
VTAPRDGADRLKKFLLGDVPDAEREAIERQCLAEHSLIFEQLAMLEDELRFDYLQGRLNASDVAKFEKRYLADTEGRDKLAFAQAMLLSADETPMAPPKPTGMTMTQRVTMAGLGVVIAAMGLVSWTQSTERRQLQHDLDQMQQGATQSTTVLAAAQAESAKTQAALTTAKAEAALAKDELTKEQAMRIDLEQQLAAAKKPPVQTLINTSATTPPSLAALTLKPGLLGAGGDLARIDPALASKGLNLALTLPGNSTTYQMYAAALLSSEGKPVWTAAHLTRAGKAVPFTIPAGRLKRSDYQVLLRGILGDGRPEDLAGYAFRVMANASR